MSYLRLNDSEFLMTWRQEIYRSTFRNSWGFFRVHLWSLGEVNGGPIGELGTLGIFLGGLLGPEIKVEFNINNMSAHNCKLFCLSENLTYSLEIIREHIILGLLENSVWGPKWEWGTLGIFFFERGFWLGLETKIELR